jgi:hypothetical protein
MLNIKLDKKRGIALLEPVETLSKEDFEKAAAVIDPYIEKAGKLHGIVIHTESFPGWDSFGALIRHLKFIKDHHRKVARIALATDSALGSFAEHVASHFVSAEVKHFPFGRFIDAQEWASAPGE